MIRIHANKDSGGFWLLVAGYLSLVLRGEPSLAWPATNDQRRATSEPTSLGFILLLAYFCIPKIFGIN